MVVPIATIETTRRWSYGQNATVDRQLLRDIPRIGQDDLFARASSRCALALLHSHQVADVGQHRLEVRHFPRWSLNLSTLDTAHPGAVFSTTLGSLSRTCSSHCRDAGNATDADILIERPTCNELRETDSSVGYLRAISTEGTTNSTSSLRSRLTTLPSNTTQSPAQLVYHSRGRDRVDLPAAHCECFLVDENDRGTCNRDAVLYTVIHDNGHGQSRREATAYRLTARELRSLEPARICVLIGGSPCVSFVSLFHKLASDAYHRDYELI